MDDLYRPAESLLDTEVYVNSGWSALERGDLEGARAALHELYSTDPTHPALPLLAAGIRRVRPKRVPWRAVVLLIVVVAGVVGVSSWNRHNRVTPPQRKAANVASSTQSTTPPPDEKESVLGTAGREQSPTFPASRQNPSSTTIDEDVIVRQAIKRFELAYRNRWGELTFAHCDISREIDQATAICIPRPAPDTSEPESDRVWAFSLRKAEGGWRITSVQPPVVPHH
jgi:hypothetical protein